MSEVKSNAAVEPALCETSGLPPFEARVALPPLDAGGGSVDWLKGLPAKRAVYLLSDVEDRPVQLLCVGNLRASVRRRLLSAEEAGASKRVDYRAIVRFVHYRRVDSDLESDLVYLDAARSLFPGRYSDLIGFRPSVWVHVDPAAAFPRFVRTTDLSPRAGVLLGPVEDLGSAAGLVERMESAFDLCRHHHILVEAPNGKACAYKDMGRCPAPCDGSIGMDPYREMVGYGLRVLLDPADAVRQQELRMKQAAGELRFELAGRIKQYVDELSELRKGPWRHVRRLEDFQFVVLVPGPASGGDGPRVKVFLVTPGMVTEEFGVLGEVAHVGELLRHLLEEAERRRGLGVDAAGAERMAVVVQHLFRPKRATGVFLPLGDLDERGLRSGLREAGKPVVARRGRSAELGDEEEGMTRVVGGM